jgi:hypothetical protein
MMERDSNVHVDIGDDAKFVVKGDGKITFQLELGGSSDEEDVLYVPSLKNNCFLVSAMVDMDFSVTFDRGKVIIHIEKSSSNKIVVVGFKEGALYRL